MNFELRITHVIIQKYNYGKIWQEAEKRRKILAFFLVVASNQICPRCISTQRYCLILKYERK